jgi:septum formation topological specificity factor MinE
MIVFTKHARDKFVILRRHGFRILERQIITTIEKPDKIDYSRLPLLIAQRRLHKVHVLRVVYKIENDIIKVITFYPGRIQQYEK